jgi:hypothetical protein
MPKKGLMAMAGTISAPFSAGLGAIHTPPVSGDREREREKGDARRSAIRKVKGMCS